MCTCTEVSDSPSIQYLRKDLTHVSQQLFGSWRANQASSGQPTGSRANRASTRFPTEKIPGVACNGSVVGVTHGRNKSGEVRYYILCKPLLRNGVSVGAEAVEWLRNRVYPRSPRVLNARDQMPLLTHLEESKGCNDINVTDKTVHVQSFVGSKVFLTFVFPQLLAEGWRPRKARRPLQLECPPPFTT